MEAAKKSINELFVGEQPFEIVVKTTSVLVAVWLAGEVFVNFKDIKRAILRKLFSAVRSIPGVEGKIKEETKKAMLHLKESLRTEGQNYLEIPEHGIPYETVLSQMRSLKATDDRKHSYNKMSGCIYLGDDKHTDFINAAYSMFSITNPLHAGAFPSVKKFEGEIIKMTVNMMHGTEHCCGAMTSGGTESILMAVKAYREQAREKGILEPELVAPVSAHCAFDKACHYFKIKLVSIPLDKEYMVDTVKLRKAINHNTIAIVGSAPGFPHGIIDPIPELAQIAQAHDIGLHVDTCLGGFVLPFAEQLGYEVPIFDFRLPGVTSMSADVHKYAFSPKGTSVIMFRNHQLRAHMYFIAENWPGGVYASPTVAGSRPGGLIAGAWASLIGIGRDGYLKYVDGIMKTTREILEGIKNIPELFVIGTPKMMLVAFGSKVVDIFRVNAGMSKRGWNLSPLQYPSAVHICVTARHIGSAPTFIQDLRESVAEVKADPAQYAKSSAAMYGVVADLPDRSIVVQMATEFIDTILDPVD